jgi:L-threonylcarbamoyladenylate synthase
MVIIPKLIAHYAHRIHNGEIGIIPCDTILGLVGRGTLTTHYRLCQIKQRDPTKPFLWLISQWSQLKTLVKTPLSPFQMTTLRSLWPGPTTVILPKNDSISDELTGNKKTIAIRYPDFIPVQWIIKSVGHPLLSTSINHSNCDECLTIDALPDHIRNTVDFIWTPFLPYYNHPSRIIDLTQDIVTIVRK